VEQTARGAQVSVWDYVHDRSVIPFTQEALHAEVDRYVNDPERDHAHDLANFAEADGGPSTASRSPRAAP
jgi:hypothetical protein